MKLSPVSTTQLYKHSLSSKHKFSSTRQLEPLDEIIGQARAQEAVHFALAMPKNGYNIYAVGRNGLGKRTMMLRYLGKHCPPSYAGEDWVYVNNFDDTRNPKAIRLPAGFALKLRNDVESLMSRLVKAIPQAYDNDSYYERSELLKNELGEKQEKLLAQLANSAKRKKVRLTISTPGGYRLVAMNGDDPHTVETFAQLTEVEQAKFEEVIDKLEKKLRGVLRKLATWEQEYSDKQQELNDEVTSSVISHHLDALEEKYSQQADVVAYMKAMRKDIIQNVDIFLEDSEEQASIAYASLDKKLPRRYQVNALVHRENNAPPIIVEDNPNYHNLFGYVESITFKGTVFTDYALIRPGSLHRANGGYLLMDAIKVLEQPFVWDGLKRALRSNAISINSLERELTLSGTISLEPVPIPLEVKIILFGDRETYLLLQQYDPEFMELFKVTADFESEMPRNEETEYKYAQFISSLVHEKGLKHCDKKAVMRLIEHSSRVAEDQTKLSLHAAYIANLLRESNYWADQDAQSMILRPHIERALASADYRSGKLRDHIYESVRDGSTLLSVQGKTVGQVNALSVYLVGESEFGVVSRVTATSRYGDGDVIDIERDVKLGGTIHSKGMMILSSHLASMLGLMEPMLLSASITFEQSYGEVDGDSATLAEYCSLLSALSGVAVRQDFAITGSMNQHGEVQPVGGLNEKIEGFFDSCKILGLTGTQGVVIPRSNVRNLMLKEEVVQACKAGQFAVYGIDHVNEAVSLMLDMPAGKVRQRSAGKVSWRFPKNTVYGHIQSRMQQIKDYEKQEMEEAKAKTEVPAEH